MKTHYYLLLLVTAFVAGCGNTNEENTGKTNNAGTDKPVVAADETIIATVDGNAIPSSRLDAYMRPGINETREELIENIIASDIIARAARRAGLHKKTAIAQQLVVAEQTVLGRAYTQQFLENNPVTDAQISLRYEELQKEFADRKEYLASHILIKEEEEAKTLYAQVSKNPDTFAEQAKEHSEDLGSAQNGGSLGWVEARLFVPEFAAALKSTPPGELAPAPVSSKFGWHIIWVEDARPLSLPPLNDETRQHLEQAVRIDAFTQHLNALRKKITIVINEAEAQQ